MQARLNGVFFSDAVYYDLRERVTLDAFFKNEIDI